MLLDCIDLTGNLNDDFEYTVAGDYVAGVNPGFGGWTVTSNQVTVISDPTLAYNGSTNLLALADGQISRILPTVPGQTYTLSYAYRGPGAVGLWRGESNTLTASAGTIPPLFQISPMPQAKSARPFSMTAAPVLSPCRQAPVWRYQI